MFDARVGELGLPKPGAVARAVVREHGPDVDAGEGEPPAGGPPERDRGGGLLVVEDLAVRDAAVVIERGVDVLVAHPRGVAGGAVLGAVTAMGPPAAAGAEPAELLDV